MAPLTPGAGGMSSKVLTMKFMQRAAAANAPASPSDSKKRMNSEGVSDSDVQKLATAEAVKAAVKEMENKQHAAMERHVANTADTHWVLEGVAEAPVKKKPLLNVVYVGYGVVDAEDSEAEENFDDVKTARTRTANYKAVDEVKNEDSESTGSESDTDDDATGSKFKKLNKIKKISGRGVFDALPRPATPAPVRSSFLGAGSGSGAPKRTRSEDPRGRELRDKRLKKEVKGSQMNRVTKTPFGHRAPGGVGLECHTCGQKGHKRADCPRNKVRR